MLRLKHLENFSDLKRSFKSLSVLYDNAFKFVQKSVAENPSQPFVIVSDIDDTVLFRVHVTADSNDDDDDDHHSEEIMVPIEPAIKFYKQVSEAYPRQVLFCFLTARPVFHKDSNQRQWTKDELREIGLFSRENDNLVLMPVEMNTPKGTSFLKYQVNVEEMANFKNSVRQHYLIDRKMSVLLNVGDRASDHTGRTFVHFITYAIDESTLKLQYQHSSLVC